MRQSLSRRLLFILSASIVSAWLATAFFSYLDTKHLMDDALDARLDQAAHFIRALVERLPKSELAKSPLEGINAEMLAYRVWVGGGRDDDWLSGMPVFLSNAWRPGFGDRYVGKERWRVYGAKSENGLLIEVAQPYSFRETFAENVAAHLLHPVWFAIPILAALIWFAVRWGLAPLRAIARNVERRSANDLHPLNPHEAPLETRPLLDSLNRLFAKITFLLEKERQFTSDAAHELRTPLAAIKTHAQVAQKAGNGGERSRALENVTYGLDRTIRLVEQLLILARLDHQSLSLALGRVNLAQLIVRGIVEETPKAAAKRIDLGIMDSGIYGEEISETIVMGNVGLLEIMIRNLLDNAIRYTTEGGTINVYIRNTEGGVMLSISDTGVGIPKEQRQRVFNRFYRIGGSEAQGSGLGLSIVSRIAEIHHAFINLEEGPSGAGLTVRVGFPGDGVLVSRGE